MAHEEAHDGGTTTARSRRRLLAAAAATGLGVIAGETIGGAAPARADNSQPVLQGTDNGHPTARTAVLTANEMGVLADPNTSGHGSIGVYGVGQDVGVRGEGVSGSGPGVLGIGSGESGGVSGTNTAVGPGVTGTGGVDGPGVAALGGTGASSTGANAGVSAMGGPPNGPGMIAWGSLHGSGPGVIGRGTGTAHGVTGIGGSGGGNGVVGRANTKAAAGVLAKNGAGGDALRVSGKTAFSRSGILTITAGSSSTGMTKIALTSASFVLATIQGNVAGVYVQGVTLVTGSPGSFTIHLNKAVPVNTKVAWFVVN